MTFVFILAIDHPLGECLFPGTKKIFSRPIIDCCGERIENDRRHSTQMFTETERTELTESTHILLRHYDGSRIERSSFNAETNRHYSRTIQTRSIERIDRDVSPDALIAPLHPRRK